MICRRGRPRSDQKKKIERKCFASFTFPQFHLPPSNTQWIPFGSKYDRQSIQDHFKRSMSSPACEDRELPPSYYTEKRRDRMDVASTERHARQTNEEIKNDDGHSDSSI